MQLKKYFVMKKLFPAIACLTAGRPKLTRSMAGHSHWHNIRHKKARNDAARSKLVSLERGDGWRDLGLLMPKAHASAGT